VILSLENRVPVAAPVPADKRSVERRAINLPARLAWKDQRGVNRFASVVTRDISDDGVYVECLAPLPLSVFRLVQFQLEPTLRTTPDLPEPLRRGRVLSAVYRVSPPSRTGRTGVALRLMVEPKRRALTREATRATA
jgi:hypothetical protein